MAVLGRFCHDDWLPEAQMRQIEPYSENGGAKLDHGSGGEVLLRAA